ncbi:hypothetical protein BG53_07210 [Paenibacillus darwinianus]|uniref:Uncharacterized protein n=1 Tax=Paenibacillus darwinianus TaxID=1380763 RepID=A0A9W5RZD1_9BACL|nr:hypothetical protein [Paenibacillus darwinianus]EXX85939.1 hypothetical protein CH50_08325 [Paenibacillus darwinianus]EXX86006.1 hypothetical protein BG53_07210 [Paenibacillus darwinianus]EXX86106.1 hypothetical protein BG52_07170 [Paenibacillus darwinianus]
MKILFLFILFFLLSMAVAIMMDLMMGMNLSMSLRNMKNPFWVMTVPEYVILFVLLAGMVISIFTKKQAQPPEKS